MARNMVSDMVNDMVDVYLSIHERSLACGWVVFWSRPWFCYLEASLEQNEVFLRSSPSVLGPWIHFTFYRSLLFSLKQQKLGPWRSQQSYFTLNPTQNIPLRVMSVPSCSSAPMSVPFWKVNIQNCVRGQITSQIPGFTAAVSKLRCSNAGSILPIPTFHPAFYWWFWVKTLAPKWYPPVI